MGEGGVRFEVCCQLVVAAVEPTGDTLLGTHLPTFHIWGMQEDVPEMIPHAMAVGLPGGF